MRTLMKSPDENRLCSIVSPPAVCDYCVIFCSFLPIFTYFTQTWPQTIFTRTLGCPIKRFLASYWVDDAIYMLWMPWPSCCAIDCCCGCCTAGGDSDEGGCCAMDRGICMGSCTNVGLWNGALLVGSTLLFHCCWLMGTFGICICICI